MNQRNLLTLVCLTLLSSGCTGSLESIAGTPPSSGAGGDTEVAPIELIESTSPFSLGSVEAKFIQNHSYGDHTRNKLDIFIPKAQYDAQTPTSLVIYIHGGGFTSGSKENAYATAGAQNMISTFLSNGIAFASINYPYIDSPDTEGVIKPLTASKRALQYLRYHKASFNINSSKILLMGSSAGASTSLWIAMKADMADSASSDPISRQTTRVQGVAATETQGTLDLVAWETIFASYSFSLSSITSTAVNFYAATQLSDLNSEPYVSYRNDVDILSHMDASDPEIWVANDNIPDIAPTTTSILYHHPYQAKALKDRADAVGMTSKFYITGLSISDPSNESMTNFILRKLQ